MKKWKKVQDFIKSQFDTDQVNIESVLYLIGMQEAGIVKSKFSKTQKKELMHVAVCRLLEADGYYKFVKNDRDGWPHFEKKKSLQFSDSEEQESFIKEKIVDYFDKYL